MSDGAGASTANSSFRNLREPPPRSYTEGGCDSGSSRVDIGYQGVDETLMLMRDARYVYVPRTQRTDGGGSERSSYEVLHQSRALLRERNSDTLEAGLAGDSLAFHASMTYQHHRQLEGEKEMQNAATSFGEAYRAKANAKKLAKTIELPTSQEEVEAPPEAKEEPPKVKANKSQWTIEGTRREVHMLMERKQHAAQLQAVARLLELQNIASGGKSTGDTPVGLTPQGSKLVLMEPSLRQRGSNNNSRFKVTPSSSAALDEEEGIEPRHQHSSPLPSLSASFTSACANEAIDRPSAPQLVYQSQPPSSPPRNLNSSIRRKSMLQIVTTASSNEYHQTMGPIPTMGSTRLSDGGGGNSIRGGLEKMAMEELQPRNSLPSLSPRPPLASYSSLAPLQLQQGKDSQLSPKAASSGSSPPSQPLPGGRFSNIDADRERNSTGGLRHHLNPLAKRNSAKEAAALSSKATLTIKSFTFDQVNK